MAENRPTQIITTFLKEMRSNLGVLPEKLEIFAWSSEARKDGIVRKFTLHRLPELFSPLDFLFGDGEERFRRIAPCDVWLALSLKFPGHYRV
jgi:hypothetical protein